MMYDDIMRIIIILIMVILLAALLIHYLEDYTLFLIDYLVRCRLKSITKKEIMSDYTEGLKIA